MMEPRRAARGGARHGPSPEYSPLRSLGLVAFLAALLLALPARAQAPTQQLQELLIKTTLLTFNDANLTGNYAVLNAKAAKIFRSEFSPERLKEVFKGFVEKKIDLSIVAIKAPVATEEPKLDQRGALLLRGYFDTTPNQIYYELDYLLEDGEWKPINLGVSLKAPTDK
jgi:hypothetical protein